MAIDAGTFVWSVPLNGQATDAALAIAGNVTTATDKAFFLAEQPIDVYEVGAIIGTVTAATTYVFTVATAPAIGGAYTVQATVTGPAGAAIPAGSTLKKFVKIRVPKGGVLRFTVTGAPASGTAQLYAICAVAGAPVLGVTGGVAGGAVNEVISTT
jgi:hypothetical protein